jgi:hypothetical protein
MKRFESLMQITFLIGVVILILALGAIPVQAGRSQQEDCQADTTWKEIRSGNFVIIYPLEYERFAQGIEFQYLPFLEEELKAYTQVFQQGLTLPVVIRVYRTIDDYYCLNAHAARISTSATHSHIGSREIALVRENILQDVLTWEQEAINALRAELVILFAVHLTEGNAPEGLLTGIGGYAENPQEVFLRRYVESGLESEPTLSWQTLWENPDDITGAGYTLQTTSIVAFLVDAYGWGSFIQFLSDLSDYSGYRQALKDVFGYSVLHLQETWRDYFSYYVQDRWRSNVLHGYDLAPYEKLIEEGAYADVLEDLPEIISVMEVFEGIERVAYASSLLERAELGQRAGLLLGQARQALQVGEYENCLRYLTEAEEYYDLLGDARRNQEIEEYRAWAEEVIELRARAEELKNAQGLRRVFTVQRLQSLGKRLGELGDQEGVARVEEVLKEVSEQQRNLIQSIIILGLVVSVLGVVLLVLLIRKPSPPEATLS